MLSSALPGTRAGPLPPPSSIVSRCRRSKPDIRCSPWQETQLRCRILLAVSWSGEADCAKAADNARNRMGIDANGLVNTAERVIVSRSKE